MQEDDPKCFTCWLGLYLEEDQVQFQSSFCLKCGNYIHRYPYCSC